MPDFPPSSGGHLHRPRVWWTVGALLVTAVVVFSLLPAQQVPQIGVSDRTEHLVAYGGLMYWFGQLQPGRRARLNWATAFFLLGVVIEFLQPILSNRFRDAIDAASNGAGILLALLLLQTPLSAVLATVDRRLAPGR